MTWDAGPRRKRVIFVRQVFGPEGMLFGPNPLLEFVSHGGRLPGHRFGPDAAVVAIDVFIFLKNRYDRSRG
jgi:hypothetical protein